MQEKVSSASKWSVFDQKAASEHRKRLKTLAHSACGAISQAFRQKLHFSLINFHRFGLGLGKELGAARPNRISNWLPVPISVILSLRLNTTREINLDLQQSSNIRRSEGRGALAKQEGTYDRRHHTRSERHEHNASF